MLTRILGKTGLPVLVKFVSSSLGSIIMIWLRRPFVP